MELAPFLIYLFYIFLISTFASSILFSRISIKYINKNMEKDGVDPPSWDRGIGASASFYIFAMFFERSRTPTPMFDARFVAKHARPIDRVIAAAHFISVTGMIICLCIITLFKSFY